MRSNDLTTTDMIDIESRIAAKSPFGKELSSISAL